MSESSASARSITRIVLSKKMRNSSECRICCFSSSVSSLGGAFYAREIVREEKGTIKNCSGEIPPVKALAYPESKALLIRIKTALKLKVLWDILIVL